MTTTRDTPEERMNEYGRLFGHALAGRERTSAGLTFRFTTKPGVEEWVRDLSKREAACCAFFDYTITVDDDQITWLIATDGNPVAETILDEMYRLPDIAGDGLPALLEQLGSVGLTVNTPGDGHVTAVS